MSRKKLERQLNLAMCLMATTRYLSVDEVADLVPGYARDGSPDGETAFRRMFERDKAELRELGIPVQTGGATGWDDEIGYRIERRDYALPDLHLTPEEAAALGLAARLWSSATLAEPTARARCASCALPASIRCRRRPVSSPGSRRRRPLSSLALRRFGRSRALRSTTGARVSRRPPAAPCIPGGSSPGVAAGIWSATTSTGGRAGSFGSVRMERQA